MVETITYKVKGSIDQVVPIYADLNKFAEYHPLISKVEEINFSKVDRLYKVYEKPFSWLPVRISYKAKVIQKSDFTVAYEITEIPFTRAFFNYVFSAESNDSVQIRLSIELQSKMIHKKILMNMMTKAQDRVVDSIRSAAV